MQIEEPDGMVLALFEHFGPEVEFTEMQAFRFLFPDHPRTKVNSLWCRGVRTHARKNAGLTDDHYLVGGLPGKRLCFTKDEEHLIIQRARGEGNSKGQQETLLELMRVLRLVRPNNFIDEVHLKNREAIYAYELATEEMDRRDKKRKAG